MEAVRAFNNELSSLYETRPPVSRAKMASVTKCAIKAIKFYKHVVQSVEKFVQKCKPEYKVPGLYVIDSIVRQSRHQFGSEKDVFAPRFTKNIVSTFQNLFKCPQEERCRVVRVLNLWQKNNVFPVEVIQPLLDLAADPNNVELVLAAQRAVEKVVSTHQKDSDLVARASSNGGSEESLLAQQSEIFNTVTRLLQQTGDGSLLANAQESQLQQLQLLQQQLMMHTEMMSSKPLQTPPILDSSLLAQIKMLTDQLLSKTSDSTPPPQNSQTNSGLSISTVGDGGGNSGGGDGGGGGGGSSMSSVEESGSVPPIKKSSEPCFNKKLLDFDYGDSDDEEDKREENSNVQQEFPGSVHTILSNPALMQHIQQMSASLQKSEPEISDVDAQEALRRQHLEQQQQQFDKEISQGQFQSYKQQDNQPAVIVVDDDQSGSDYNRDREQEFDKDRRRSKRSHERSRSPRRRRHSRSRSRDRRRSRDRHRRSRSRDHDREQQKEKERERKKKGLPPLKDRHISVCTRTLWFGHLAKHTTEDELRAEIEKYGGIDAINMIPPRGCAFVCMSRRKDASKALDRLKGYKLNSSSLRVAWAPGIGVKESSFKDLWDVELGVTYIPWSKMPSDLVPLTEGGMIDDDSLPEHLKGSQIGPQDQDDDGDSRPSAAPSVDNQLSQMPNFGIPLPGIPSSQPIHIMPPPMMIPIPSQPPPQLQSQGHLPSIQMPHLGQGLQPPQGLPPNLLAPQGGQSMPVSTTISLPSGVSLSQAVSVAASLLGAPPPGLPISSVATMAAMSADRQNLGPGIPTISTAALLPQGPQQPGILARPGFPPPGPPGSPFGLVPNLQMRPPGFLHSGQGLRAPVSMHIEKEMEEPKEWPADDNMLEEEALAALEEDMDHRVGGSVGPGGDPQQNLQKGPAPLMTMQMMGMRMRLPPPPPGGPRMAMQMAGNGSSRPGMMMDMTRSSNPGMSGFPMGPGGAFGPGIGRPGGILGPRLVRPGGPQIIGGQEGPEAMMRNPMQGNLMGSQAGTTMGMRLGLMGGHGPPRGIGPGNMAMGQRLPGMPGSPGMHGMGTGPHGPIRIMLGNQQNTRGPGPMGLRPGVMSMDNRLPMGEAQNNMGHGGLQGPRTSGEENSLTTNTMNTGSQGQVHLSMSQGPGGMLPPGLIMGAGLRGGRPGLLGFRPNMPTNGGFRFGPQQPGGIGFRGTRPDFSIRPPGFDNPLIDGAPPFSGSLSSGTPVDDDGGVKSPEYGENFDEGSLENRASLDADLRMAVAAEAALEVSKPRERSGRQSRWSDVEKDTMLDMGNHDTQPSQTNGPTSDINSYPDASEEAAATNLSETELVGSVGEG